MLGEPVCGTGANCMPFGGGSIGRGEDEGRESDCCTCGLDTDVDLGCACWGGYGDCCPAGGEWVYAP